MTSPARAAQAGEHHLAIAGTGRAPTQAHVLAQRRSYVPAAPAIRTVIAEVKATCANCPLHAAQTGVSRVSLKAAARGHVAVTQGHWAAAGGQLGVHSAEPRTRVGTWVNRASPSKFLP